MLAFLLHIGASSHFPEDNAIESKEEISNSKAIYFDILVILGYANHMPFKCFIMYDMH